MTNPHIARIALEKLLEKQAIEAGFHLDFYLEKQRQLFRSRELVDIVATLEALGHADWKLWNAGNHYAITLYVDPEVSDEVSRAVSEALSESPTRVPGTYADTIIFCGGQLHLFTKSTQPKPENLYHDTTKN